MSLIQLLNRPVSIIHRSASGTLDDYGNDTPTETIVTTVGEIQQRRRSESDDQGETSDTDWVIFLPAGTLIDTGDAVIVDDEEYEMVGDPWQARNPRTQAESHIEASLRRTAGEVGS